MMDSQPQQKICSRPNLHHHGEPKQNLKNLERDAPVCEGTKAEADAKRARRANTVFIMVVLFVGILVGLLRWRVEQKAGSW